MKGRHGGKRAGAGRPAGRQNTATVSQKQTLTELARSYTDVALGVLVHVAKKGESETARVAAANSILDRGYGKATQAHRHAGPSGGPIPIVDLTTATDDQLDAIEAIFGPLAAAGGDDGGDSGGEGEAGG